MRKQRRVCTATLLIGVALVVQTAFRPPPAAATDQDWPRWETPEEAGFASAAIAEAEQYWSGLPDAPLAAFVIIYKGKILASSGRQSTPFWCHSMRKSFLSALYGAPVANGTIDLDMTLEELGIDDITPLTPTEKQARVVHLLKARSGIYIEAACESPEMKAARPPRGSHAPDTFWYYNNWDFNALGTIFRQETGRDIFDEFERRIGRPIGMQDFQPGQCQYAYESHLSEHPCYTFRMSVRDRARVGQLFLQNGRWGDRQVVSEEWVAESTRKYSETGTPGLGYSFMWWTHEPDFFRLFLQDPRLWTLRGFAAHGYGGQVIMVLPDAEVVVVFAVDVPAGGDLYLDEAGPVLDSILTGREIIDLRAVRARVVPQRAAPGGALRLVARLRNKSAHPSLPTTVDFYLVPEKSFEDGARWLASAPVEQLAPGMRKTVRLKTVLPENLPPGRYYLAALADRDKSNYDLDRANNLQVGRKLVVE